VPAVREVVARHNGRVTDDAQREANARWLCSPEAVDALATARAVTAAEKDPLRAGAALRSRLPGLSAEQAAAVLEQAALVERARDRYGIDRPLLLTRDGLEAATRPVIAARRARLLVAAGVARVLDITGGLGFDSSAFAAAGLAVTAVERDPATALLLAHNLPSVRVVQGDATDAALLPTLLAPLTNTDVVFADPARRDPAGPRDRATGRARPERDPERWSPPWSAVAAIAHSRIAAKVAPGFTPPPGWQAEWVSVDRTVVECAVYSWDAIGADRQAVVVAGDAVTVIRADESEAPLASSVGPWLHEVDVAVSRAGATAALAGEEGLAGVGEESSWLTGDHASTSPALRSYLVTAELTGGSRQRRRQLADFGITRCTVKSRDVSADPRAELKSLGVSEGPDAVVVMTRRAGRVVSWLTQPASARPR
jgi:hypothetical protein